LHWIPPLSKVPNPGYEKVQKVYPDTASGERKCTFPKIVKPDTEADP